MKSLLLFSSALLMLVISVPTAHGCSCIFPHLQNQLCDSQMVIRVKILWKSPWPADINGDMYYIVQFEHVWKDDSGFGFAAGGFAIITTCANGACCGFNPMNVGESWVFNAYADPMGFLHIGLCGYNRLWSSMSGQEKKNIQRYLNNCDCENRFCWLCNDDNCKGAIDGCKWFKYIDDKDYDSCRSTCQAKHSFCMRQKYGKCDWKNSKALMKCLAKCSQSCSKFPEFIAFVNTDNARMSTDLIPPKFRDLIGDPA